MFVHNETNDSLPKAKTKEYDTACVALGFTVTTEEYEENRLLLFFSFSCYQYGINVIQLLTVL